MEPESEQLSAGFSLPEYLAVLRRRRLIILQAFVLITVIGVVVTLMSKPVYEASAKMLIEGPSYNLNNVDTSNPLSDLFSIGQQQTVETQVEVLQSGPLLDAVTKEVGPADMTVTPVKDTNVIEVVAESGDPKTAAEAPNTLLRMYIDQDSGQSMQEMEQARLFVERGSVQAHKALVASESALSNFKQKNHVAELVLNRDDQIARVAMLTTEDQKNQMDLSVLKSQIAADTHLMNVEPKTVQSEAKITNPVIGVLQNDIRSLEVQRVGMIQVGGFTPEAPQVKAVDAEIAALNRKVAQQSPMASQQTVIPSTVREQLRTKLIELAAQMPALQTQADVTAKALADAKADVGRYANLELAQDRLVREHDGAAAEDKQFIDKLSDLTLREKAHHATAHIIESAQVPYTPIRPKKGESIFFAALIGLFTGLCLALFAEFLDDRINSIEDASRVLGLPSLGLVPALSEDDAHLLPQMKGLDPASESYRVLRTNIHFATVDAPARTLLVTSSNPGEGKTTTAANLAFAMAMDGKTVILVDCDLRRPSVHKLLSLSALPGVTDVLLGNSALKPQEVMPGLSVLTAGSTPPNPGELLNSRKFRNLVETLTQQADIVIFDSPPMLAAADAAILASQMDGTVLVVETGETKKGAARRSLQLLTQARANVLGVAYNKMRKSESSGYDYYYTYQYGTPALDNAKAAAARPLLPVGSEKDEE